MTVEEKIRPSQKQPFILPPWLVILGALLLYGVTLNRWVTMHSLPIISGVTGWDWHPYPLSWRPCVATPLFFVLTCPLRLLPAAWQPLALNAFAAICAALALGLLGASVRLLPHDRTKEQRQRESGEFSLLSLPAAFLPALFAVLMMGLQLTFWREAISANGDILDLLVFAFLIFCLLKFRVSQNDDWMSVFAFVYGLGTTNNWALMGFFPFFLGAVIWIKKTNFFNARFLARMAGCGALGLLLYLVIPAISSLSSERANFLSVLHFELGAQSFGLRVVPRWIVAVAALPTLLPLIFAGIRWPSFEGELSSAGNAMTKFMFRVLHIVFLLLALVLFFNFRYSPALRLQEASISFLTFYYMGALCVGYFSGYVLLVFGRGAALAWEKHSPVAGTINLLVVASLWLLAVAAPVGLWVQNISYIKAGKGNALPDFAEETVRDLPAKPVIILSDDPVQLDLLQAIFSREGKPDKNILIETPSLSHREYLVYLVARYPELKKVTSPTAQMPRTLPPGALTAYLYNLTKNFSIYYLQPSFGYYFEAFYLKPHGLVYQLHTYPSGVIEPPSPTSEEIKENQDIWAGLEKKMQTTLPSKTKLDPDAAIVGNYMSVALNFWGVCLQKGGYLKEANAQLAEAARIQPQNFIAKINRQYNERLQKNDHRPIDTGDLIYRAINLYHGMVPILKYNGPVDEPDLNLDFGRMMAEGHNYRQAAILFERRLELLPGDANAQLDLAKTFVDWGASDKAIEMVHKLRDNPAANKWEVSRVEALAYYARNDFPSAERLMLEAFKENPHDEKRVVILAEFYRVTAETALRQANEAARTNNIALHDRYASEATRRFQNALTYLDQQVQLLTLGSPTASDPYGVPDALLKKAEVEMMLKSFEASIATLTQIIAAQPANPTALLNRAIAEIQVKQYPAAKSDFKKLRKLLPNQIYVIDYGLADIAHLENNRGEEIRYLKHYLGSAPDDHAEYQQVKQRLRKLQSS
jgi:tetratricopeptide (TPR) repeat protein